MSWHTNVTAARVGVAAITCAAALTTGAVAEPMDLEIDFPVTSLAGQGVTRYDCETDLLSIGTTPMVIQLAEGSPRIDVLPIGDPPNKTVALHARVNDQGELVGGIDGHDFVMVGQVDLDGDGDIDASGILLTGEVTSFGFQDGKAGRFRPDRPVEGPGADAADALQGIGSSIEDEVLAMTGFLDEYQFTVAVTGGVLEPFYGDATLGLAILSEQSTFRGDFSVDFGGQARGHQGVVEAQVLSGACCLPDGTCIETSVFGCAFMGGDYLGDETECTPEILGETGDYRLLNALDGGQFPPPYGLRLDELFDLTPELDRFNFDFEAPGADMRLRFDGDSIRIFGVAFGGWDIGDTYDPAWTSYVKVDVTYFPVESAAGDDDLVKFAPVGQIGTLTWLATGEVIDLFDEAVPGGLTFRFGDEDDDMGHAGYDGISGWGWLQYASPVTNGLRDWRFRAVDLCEDPDPQGACCMPDGSCMVVTEATCIAIGGIYDADNAPCEDDLCPLPAIGACCLPDETCIETTEDQCNAAGGDYQGDDTLCMDVSCVVTPVGACCLPDFSCIVTTEASCLMMGGLYQGDETACEDVDCTPPATGACCLPDGSCDIVTADDCDALGGLYLGDDVLCTPDTLGEPGLYRLRNHPEGNAAPPGYGLRLDELFDVTDGLDVFTFDFDGPDADVRLEYDGTSIRITGTAFGGLDAGLEYDPAWTSLVSFDFTYAVVETAPGDDDLIVTTPSMTNTGTLTWLATGEVIDLFDKANDDGFTFRLGDEDDDMGHRDFPGISGWGWLAFDHPVDGGARDWLFIAVPICEPAPPMGACCLPGGDCVETTVDQCLALGGMYAGDDVPCGDVDCTPMAEGACCLPDGSCHVLSELDCLDLGGEFQGVGTACTPPHLGDPGMYRLASHPFSPDWGLRLDELFDVTGGNDVFTFDFDHPDADMRAFVGDGTVHIVGTAWGGLRDGSGYDPDWVSVVAIDFLYEMVETASGDDDLIVTTPGMTNTGSITWLATGEAFPLTDKSNGSFTFRLGDEGDDDGHDGWPGLSGWGWLLHSGVDVGTWKDWRFIALPVCPTTSAAGLVAHWNFDEQGGDWAIDQIGGIALRMHGPSSDVDWNESSFGTHVDFNQSASSGDAMLRTESASDGALLREQLQATNAITVQVYYQQDGAHDSGSRVFSWSDGTAIGDRNVSIIGREGDDNEVYDNLTRLRTTNGTFNDGPEEVVDDLGGEVPCVLTVTYDAAAGDTLRIYVDGVLWYTDTSPKGDFGNWADFHIMLGNEVDESRPFQGEIYDVKIWNVALTPDQVAVEAEDLMNGSGG